MSDKPVALLLSPVLPQPGGSGRALRAWGWLQELQHDYRVHVLVPLSPGECLPAAADYPAESVLAIGSAIGSVGKWQRLLTVLFPVFGLCWHGAVVDWLTCRPRILQALTDELAGQPVQRIVVFRLYLHDIAQVMATRFPRASLYMDLDDLESRTRLSVAACLLRMGRYRHALLTAVSALQYGLLERYMQGFYQTLYLAAPGDCAGISTRLAAAVACRPNTVAAPRNLPALPPGKEIRLLFVGTLNYPPNEEAVRYILRDLLPALRKAGLCWHLSVAGRHASSELQDLLKATAHVEFLCDVDDLGACYAAAQMVLVPLRAGGGTKLKTLEAFAHQRPVVSTAHGVRGLGAAAGVHYLPAHTAQQFAAAIIQLAHDPRLAGQIAAAGRSLWQKNFLL